MLSRIVPTTPVVCPVPVEYLRRAANIDQTYDDDILLEYGTVATDLIEKATNRFILQRDVNWTLSLDTRATIFYSFSVTLQNYFSYFPQPWLHCPHSAITFNSFSIGNWNVTPDTTLVAGTDYAVDINTDPARIQLLNFGVFNSEVDHLTANYTTGYGTDYESINAVAPGLLTAIKVMTARMYQNRDTDVELWTPIINSLIGSYTVYQFSGNYDLENS